ncbi:MAG: hypothetical protein ACI37T_02235 [Candidatus Gastranaerophilaceae bacterium]
MIIFNAKKLFAYNNIKDFILKAMEFEIVWLKYIGTVQSFTSIDL